MATAVEAGAKATQAEQGLRRRWLTVFSLSSASLIDSMESFTMQILWPHMYPTLGIGVSQLGRISSIAGLVSTITMPIWGFLADRISRKLILVLVTGLWGLWTSAVGLVQNLPQLLAVRVASSLGLAALYPTAVSLLSDLFPSDERGRAVGIMSAAGFAGSMVSFVLLPMLAMNNPEGWRIGFLIMGGASFVTGLLLVFVDDPPRGSAEPELADVVSQETETRLQLSRVPVLFKVPSWFVLLATESFDWIAFSILSTWAFTWLDTLALEGTTMVVGVQFAGVVIGHVLFGWLGDRIEARWPKRGRVTLGHVGLLTGVVATSGLLLARSSLLPLMVFGMLTGLMESLSISGVRWPLLQNIMPPELRGTGRAVVDMLVGIVTAGALVLSSTLVEALGQNVALMMLILVPLPKVLASLAWIPMYRTYARDVDAMHAGLREQRQRIVEA